MFPVAEHFVSINGEGSRAGELALFIRFRGCNLCCSYCDTRWACTKQADAVMMSVQELTDIAKKSCVKNITLTGGEPLLQENISDLTDKLMDCGFRVEIETNGSVSIEALAGRKLRPAFTMDYKLPSSGMEKYMNTDNFRFLNAHDVVKLVSGSREDLIRGAEIIEKYKLTDKCHVYISPVFGEIEPSEIVDFMKERKMNSVRLQLQLHKYIWAPDRKGV